MLRDIRLIYAFGDILFTIKAVLWKNIHEYPISMNIHLKNISIYFNHISTLFQYRLTK
jgi:hypothetical protein